ncbi:hypothetical protein CN138_35075 [Sinorhizobium meliloti]|uniref:ParB N-terminal domain-containing protein n=1 Tax=Rhizobium meliloti TaxID=382 RepID=UPI0004750146|nr:ParB N-terminal domain-containing protein [Sinorhizobium meliloti]MBP2471124.1 hypothetical protein [Sinorhizobium meliloti]MDE3786304.1 ParB N-terminal domain-containing protein [Sinorhizobium meliloti]MDE4553269.1 ParB N-terminal domain-containing protein [Sinorhizobium meliloti]MDE4599725.1 ParB N-terminal domain-containing protein [Sinorhizobium meliloti]RVG20362.1 hypothetical protein CN233_35330 [Sinorhizobium meliloti]
MRYYLLQPNDLTPTEEVDCRQVLELEEEILQAKFWKTPIAVHKGELFVMDGHHRLAVAKRLQLRILPAMLLDYRGVRVEAWRLGEVVTPEIILAMARSGRKFPAKTTKHVFDSQFPECKIPLSDLGYDRDNGS